MQIETPAYVLDEKAFRSNLLLLKSVKEKAGIELILALKSFAMWKVFPIVNEYIYGATASSLAEAQLCFDAMGTKAHVYAPAYLEKEIRAIAPLASHLSFNSLAQLKKWKQLVQKENPSISLGLRINPGFSDVSTDLYNPCAPGSRLGVQDYQLESGLPDGIDGLHFHCLCESSAESLCLVLDSFEDRFQSLLQKVKWVNMGGGHSITAHGYNTALLVQRLKEFRQKYQVDVILEPGSAFGWQAGDLHSSVLDIVESHGIKTAMLDVSFTAHMPDTLEMPYRPEVEGANSNGKGAYAYRLGGGSCLAGDFLEAYGFEQPLKIGDRLVLKDMMHYTMVKTTMFNGVAHPDIVLLKTNGTPELLRRFNFNDFKNRLG